jgi:hypothetical protein
MRSRWHALTRYADDGLLEIDNSAAERSKTSRRSTGLFCSAAA